jgi:prophage antirepressor-like protein
MNQIKTENWNGNEIRFIWLNDEWQAVAADVCKALGLNQVSRAISSLKSGVTFSKVIDSLGREQETNVINEKAIYKLVFKSRKPEAEQFQDWVYTMLRELRQATGLEGFQVFRMLDKDHQKEAMRKLKDGLQKPVRVDFIKANTITNKAISNITGSPKMIKKGDMTPGMLVQRQAILDDTVELMTAVDKFNLDCSVSQKIYDRYH